MLLRDRPQCKAQRSIRPRYFSSTRIKYARSIRRMNSSVRSWSGPVLVEVEAERLLAKRDNLGR